MVEQFMRHLSELSGASEFPTFGLGSCPYVDFLAQSANKNSPDLWY